MVSGLLDVSLSPKTIYFIFGDPKKPQIIQEHVQKTGAEKIDDPSKKILKILDMRSIPIENEMKFGNMEPISFANIQK